MSATVEAYCITGSPGIATVFHGLFPALARPSSRPARRGLWCRPLSTHGTVCRCSSSRCPLRPGFLPENGFVPLLQDRDFFRCAMLVTCPVAPDSFPCLRLFQCSAPVTRHPAGVTGASPAHFPSPQFSIWRIFPAFRPPPRCRQCVRQEAGRCGADRPPRRCTVPRPAAVGHGRRIPARIAAHPRTRKARLLRRPAFRTLAPAWPPLPGQRPRSTAGAVNR